ncbi:hypothetical protein C8R44DRAFT_871810 [Mycena epipterygia]|nr:hypothetical protein C8R44DRAFT_871810 [Mycena epipterygia]
MLKNLFSLSILAILVLSQGATSASIHHHNRACGKKHDPPCPKHEYCCVPGPIPVGGDRKP